MRVKFPSGATARFSHLEYDKDAQDNHQGLEYSAIYFDELGRFSRYQFMYLMSRLRSNADSQSFIKATLNPEPDSWILDFVEWYLTPDGYADMEKSGKVRWFVSDEAGNLDWANDPDELRAKHGNDCDPMSFRFIAASIADNPVLCKLQPKYLTALKNLPRVDREILLYGNWFATPESSGLWKRSWCPLVNHKDLPRMKKTVRSYDLAVSQPSEANPNPDWTACVKMGLGEDGNYYILHCDQIRDRPAKVHQMIADYCKLDGKGTTCGLPRDPSAAGVVAFQTYAKPITLLGYKVKKNSTKGSKIDRFLPFSHASENGLVYMVKGDWNKMFISQLEVFDGSRSKKDDIVDSCSDSFNFLNSNNQVPSNIKFNPDKYRKKNRFAI